MRKEKWDIKKASDLEIKKLRRSLIIAGVILLFIFLPLSIVCFILAHTCKKELNSRHIETVKTPETVTPVQEPEKSYGDTVKVIDLDGTVRELSIHLALDNSDRVLMVEGGKSYHTHLSCFKNWNTDNFNGWKIIKKSEALALNMKYCNFCRELDSYEYDDLEDLEE